MILLLASLATAEPLVIEVGPDVAEVFLDCGLREERYRVIGGKATIVPAPTADCEVMLSKKVGTVKGGGAWACTDAGCTGSTGGGPSGAPAKPGHVGAVHVRNLDTGRDEKLPADLVLLAIGFTGHDNPTLFAALDVQARTASPIDQDHRTNHPRVFVAGDARRGASLVVNAISEGLSAADAVHHQLSQSI